MSEDNSLTSGLSKQAKDMHKVMVQNGQSSYSQEDLLKLTALESTPELMRHLQQLLDSGLARLLENKDHKVLFQPVSESEASKISNMSSDEAMIYSYIEASGREGIWTKTIKAKTNLHQHVVARCLKSLETQSYIKSVKSVKYPQRKIYMLYHLIPSIEVTGGPWFTDSELDTDFIDSLLIVIWRFVASKTFPKCFKNSMGDVKQLSYPVSNNINLPTLNDISEFILSSGVTPIELSLSDIRSLCQVLELDEKLEKIGECYKASWQSVLEVGGGKYKGLDVYGVQNDQIYTIQDTYRVLNALAEDADIEDVDEINESDKRDETKKTNNRKGQFFLDSWINI